MAPKASFHCTKIIFICSDVPLPDLFQRKQMVDSAEASSSTRTTRASARLTGTTNATTETAASSTQKSTDKGATKTTSKTAQNG